MLRTLDMIRLSLDILLNLLCQQPTQRYMSMLWQESLPHKPCRSKVTSKRSLLLYLIILAVLITSLTLEFLNTVTILYILAPALKL